MGTGIVHRHALIGSASKDLAVTNDHGTHWDLTTTTSDAGKLECFAHEDEMLAHDLTARRK